jgi:hypothetical protein
MDRDEQKIQDVAKELKEKGFTPEKMYTGKYKI